VDLALLASRMAQVRQVRGDRNEGLGSILAQEDAAGLRMARSFRGHSLEYLQAFLELEETLLRSLTSVESAPAAPLVLLSKLEAQLLVSHLDVQRMDVLIASLTNPRQDLDVMSPRMRGPLRIAELRYDRRRLLQFDRYLRHMALALRVIGHDPSAAPADAGDMFNDLGWVSSYLMHHGFEGLSSQALDERALATIGRKAEPPSADRCRCSLTLTRHASRVGSGNGDAGSLHEILVRTAQDEWSLGRATGTHRERVLLPRLARAFGDLSERIPQCRKSLAAAGANAASRYAVPAVR
jgi:hypothetical protein